MGWLQGDSGPAANLPNAGRSVATTALDPLGSAAGAAGVKLPPWVNPVQYAAAQAADKAMPAAPSAAYPGSAGDGGPGSGLIGTPPDLPPIIDPKTGALTNDARVNVNVSHGSGNAAFNAAGMPGAVSPWAGMQNSLIDQQTAQARNQAAQAASTSTQGAMDNAAMHGGLTGGGGARIAALGLMGGVQGQQAANMAGNEAKNAAGINDLKTQVGLNQFNAGQNNQMNEFNTGQNNAVDMFNVGQQNQGAATNAAATIDANKYIYGQKNNAYMGNNMANAMANTQNPNPFSFTNPSSWMNLINGK